MKEKRQAEELNNLIDRYNKGEKRLANHRRFDGEIKAASKVNILSPKAIRTAKKQVWQNVNAEIELFERKKASNRLRVFATRAAAALVALTVSTGGLSYASAGSIPGSFLYPAKRVFEKAFLVAAFSYEAKAGAYLMQARVRLDEARSLARDEGASAPVMSLISEVEANISKARTLTFYMEKDSKKSMLSKIKEIESELSRFKSSLQPDARSIEGLLSMTSQNDQKRTYLIQNTPSLEGKKITGDINESPKNDIVIVPTVPKPVKTPDKNEDIVDEPKKEIKEEPEYSKKQEEKQALKIKLPSPAKEANKKDGKKKSEENFKAVAVIIAQKIEEKKKEKDKDFLISIESKKDNKNHVITLSFIKFKPKSAHG